MEALRQDGFTGRLVLITKEPSLPYDRPKLSKALSSSAVEIRLRNPAFYEEADIEVCTRILPMKTISKQCFCSARS